MGFNPSLHRWMAYFFRFIAAYLSLTQLVTTDANLSPEAYEALKASIELDKPATAHGSPIFCTAIGARHIALIRPRLR